MKRLALLLMLAGCGSTARALLPNPQTTPNISPSVLPSPTPIVSLDTALVGNWIDANKNTLILNQDGSALSNNRNLSWNNPSLQLLEFTSNNVVVDSCNYAILSKGGINTQLVITMNLACTKAGYLLFTKVLQ